MNQAQKEERFVTPEQLSEHLQISLRDVNLLARLGRIPSHPIPTLTGKRPRRRYKISEVEASLQERKIILMRRAR